MATLWLVRHGPTHQKAFTGWRDVPADLGDTAALNRLHATLPQGAKLVSSDLIRASATADRLGAGRTRLPDVPDLRELDFGVWDGMTFDAVATRDPDLSRTFWETPGDASAPDGESWNMAAARVSRAIDALLADDPDGDLIVVAHFGAILTQIARATGKSPHATLAQDIAPLSRSRIDIGPGIGPGDWRLISVNVAA